VSKKVTPAVVCGPDNPVHLRAARDRRLEGAAHILDADADGGDFERSELATPGRRGGSRPLCRSGLGLQGAPAAEERRQGERSSRAQEVAAANPVLAF
jgi:hypothetical protein